MGKVYTIAGILPKGLEAICMDKHHRLLVAYLRKNARVKLTKLSRRMQVPVSTLFDRVRNLSTLGITRLTALLDFTALGFGTQATILIKAAAEKRDELRAYLLTSQSVNTLARVNNGYDFMAECIFRNMRELEEFSDRLVHRYGVRSKEVHFVVEELKREDVLSDPELVEKEMRKNEQNN
jgi:DNA-binding Lrp family transcriptional regulator